MKSSIEHIRKVVCAVHILTSFNKKSNSYRLWWSYEICIFKNLRSIKFLLARIKRFDEHFYFICPLTHCQERYSTEAHVTVTNANEGFSMQTIIIILLQRLYRLFIETSN